MPSISPAVRCMGRGRVTAAAPWSAAPGNCACMCAPIKLWLRPRQLGRAMSPLIRQMQGRRKRRAPHAQRIRTSRRSPLDNPRAIPARRCRVLYPGRGLFPRAPRPGGGGGGGLRIWSRGRSKAAWLQPVACWPRKHASACGVGFNDDWNRKIAATLDQFRPLASC